MLQITIRQDWKLYKLYIRLWTSHFKSWLHREDTEQHASHCWWTPVDVRRPNVFICAQSWNIEENHIIFSFDCSSFEKRFLLHGRYSFHSRRNVHVLHGRIRSWNVWSSRYFLFFFMFSKRINEFENRRRTATHII